MKRWLAGKYHKITSFEILKFEDAYIELIERHPCLCREELLKREGEIIRATENCVNKRIEGRTTKEYYRDNIDKIKQYEKEYYRDNIDKIKQQANQKHDCECGGKYTTGGKIQHFKTKKHGEYEHQNFMALTEAQVKAMLN